MKNFNDMLQFVLKNLQNETTKSIQSCLLYVVASLTGFSSSLDL